MWTISIQHKTCSPGYWWSWLLDSLPAQSSKKWWFFSQTTICNYPKIARSMYLCMYWSFYILSIYLIWKIFTKFFIKGIYNQWFLDHEWKKEKNNLRTGSIRTRLCVFGNMECNFVAENCYWGGPWRETDVCMYLAPMNSKEVSSEAKHQ